MKNQLSLTLLILLISVQTQAIKCSNELDPYFENLPAWLNTEDSGSPMSKSCISLSMNVFGGWAQALGHDESGEEGIFITCDEGEKRKSPIPQCQTPAYLNTTLNTYTNMTDCLGINLRALYPILATESGFFHNSISMSDKDFGFGQVTDPAIGDVNLSWYRFLDEVKASDKKSCQNLIQFVEEFELEPVDDQFDCTLTQAPKNPVLNALYSGFHYKLITSYMDGYEEQSNFKGRVENYLGDSFSPEIYKKLQELLVILSYNKGHNGTVMAIEEFLLMKEHDVDVLKKEREEVSTELAKVNLKLLSKPSRKLNKKKISLLVEMKRMDSMLRRLKSPKIFNGDDTPGSFGEFIVERGISHYLKVLVRRVKYISLRDSENQCHFEDIFRF
jgi:hypothetical protein